MADSRISANGDVVTGCLLAFACQLGFIFIGFLGLFLFNTFYLLVGWGATQWIGLIPLIRRERAEGRLMTAKGLLIMGCIGVLLSSACAAIFLVPGLGPRMAG